MLFINCSKMARIRIITRNHTKEKPYLINSYFFKIGKAKKSIGWAKYMYVCEWDMCWRNLCNFSLVIKKCEKWVKNSLFFFKWAPFWNLIFKKKKEKKRKQLRISEVNHLNYTHTKKKKTILHVINTFSLKQGQTRTSSGPIPHPLIWLHGSDYRHFQNTEYSFKTLYNNHISNFNNCDKRHATTLSEYIWKLEDKKISYSTEWKFISRAKAYSTTNKLCRLCL